jgi:Zn-dependent M28 family amino/carboxypeptidase
MKKIIIILTAVLFLLPAPSTLLSQKSNSSAEVISSADLRSYVTFLASPMMKGRKNGEPELDIAANYIASQAALLGLKPANNGSYFQPFVVNQKSFDETNTMFQVITEGKDTITLHLPVFQLIPTGPSDLVLEGDVVFAGYGIKSDKYKYNDLSNIKTEGKILLIMDRAPMSADGKKCQFTEPGWMSGMSLQMKLTTLIYSKAKAILFVTDPKSGFRSFEESHAGLTGQLKTSVTLKQDDPEKPNPFMAAMPKIIFINSTLADELLMGSGHSLSDLQNKIDSTLIPNSFEITGKKLKITEVSKTEEKVLNNIAGYIEGRDPVLKNEVVVFSGHYDHIGGSGNSINSGADDNASGCAALLSIAEAFQSQKKKPLRSVLFLWVSGEEIGLFGSQSYISKPLFPLDKTVADLNIDMIGRVKEAADSTKETPMTGPKGVFVIADSQSKDLLSIAEEVDKKNPVDFDYSLSGKNHPLQLFSRSDHYNFVKKDIPILNFTTGIHTDYHTPKDIVGKIDFTKMEIITRTIYGIGLEIADRKTRVAVVNPFSSWNKSK